MVPLAVAKAMVRPSATANLYPFYGSCGRLTCIRFCGRAVRITNPWAPRFIPGFIRILRSAQISQTQRYGRDFAQLLSEVLLIWLW